MDKVKTLANCTDEEFLQQANKIRHSVEKWLTVTDINNLRSRKPQLEPIPEDADADKISEITERNNALMEKQLKKNLNDVLDSALEKHPKETAELIRLCCFTDPQDKSTPIATYMVSFTQMVNDEVVLGFFQSLLTVVQTLGLTW